MDVASQEARSEMNTDRTSTADAVATERSFTIQRTSWPSKAACN